MDDDMDFGDDGGEGGRTTIRRSGWIPRVFEALLW
jgi:hypothetical protein